MDNHTGPLYILIREGDKDQLKYSNRNYFSLTPIICKESFETSKFKRSPNPILTAKYSAKIVEKVEKVTSNFLTAVKENQISNEFVDLDELLSPYIHLRLSSYYYLENIIPDRQSYSFLVNGNWKVFKDKVNWIYKTFRKIYYS